MWHSWVFSTSGTMENITLVCLRVSKRALVQSVGLIEREESSLLLWRRLKIAVTHMHLLTHSACSSVREKRKCGWAQSLFPFLFFILGFVLSATQTKMHSEEKKRHSVSKINGEVFKWKHLWIKTSKLCVTLLPHACAYSDSTCWHKWKALDDGI